MEQNPTPATRLADWLKSLGQLPADFQLPPGATIAKMPTEEDPTFAFAYPVTLVLDQPMRSARFDSVE